MRVILSISGHSHVRNRISRGNITAITVPLGYGRPNMEKIEDFVRDAVAVIEIHDSDVDVSGFATGDICAGLEYVSSRY